MVVFCFVSFVSMGYCTFVLSLWLDLLFELTVCMIDCIATNTLYN